ncbi:TonB-dependent receptor domain-containing protein, partial [Sphingomonas phyllosphaerae]|uniref:TonB-dependent receptor domain-containing protein n=1 Tax=Sphingomonas phyllosphaerae TaxID=257003 RepID=UPI003FA74102
MSPTTASGKATQFVVNGFVAGDSSQLFELPGGPVGFSVGAEYRRETLSYDLDPLTQAGYNFYNAIPSFRAPAFEVKEAYGELSLPLIKDVFLFKELRLSGAGRVADYKGGAGTVYAWDGPPRMASGAGPAAARRLFARGACTVSRRNRRPARAELQPGPERSVLGAQHRHRLGDARGQLRRGGHPDELRLRLYVVDRDPQRRQPDLKAETSNSLTLGGVFQPTFLPGLSVSVDYYDIKVKDVITGPTVQQALDACYDSPTLDNQFLRLVPACRRRWRSGRRGAVPDPSGHVPRRSAELRAAPHARHRYRDRLQPRLRVRPRQ